MTGYPWPHLNKAGTIVPPRQHLSSEFNPIGGRITLPHRHAVSPVYFQCRAQPRFRLGKSFTLIPDLRAAIYLHEANDLCLIPGLSLPTRV